MFHNVDIKYDWKNIYIRVILKYYFSNVWPAKFGISSNIFLFFTNCKIFRCVYANFDNLWIRNSLLYKWVSKVAHRQLSYIIIMLIRTVEIYNWK